MLQFYKEQFSLMLFIIPINIVMLSELAKKTVDRYYLSFLESVVILAKIEHVLGVDGPLNTKKHKSGKTLWVNDSQFVLDRWIKGRYENESSQQFVSEKMKMGDNRYAHFVFTILEVTTILLTILSLWAYLHVHMPWICIP
jgi:hypothetical protein